MRNISSKTCRPVKGKGSKSIKKETTASPCEFSVPGSCVVVVADAKDQVEIVITPRNCVGRWVGR